MKTLSRLFALGMTAILLGGCALFDWRSGKGGEENWQDAYLAREAQFTLRDGTVKTMSVPRDFGPAVCAFLSPCIAKSDIISVRWYRQTDVSRGGEIAGQVVVAALLWPITVPYMIGGLTLETNPAPERPPDWSYIPDSCGDREADVRVVIQNEQDAVTWVEENRWSLAWFCLSELGRHEWLPIDNDLRVELDVLGDIRSRWSRALCIDTKQESYRGGGVITAQSDPNDPRRGPPGYFDLVTRLFLDERTWSHRETNLAEICQHLGGVLPEAEWSERKTWMRALHPFPPAGFEEIFP